MKKDNIDEKVMNILIEANSTLGYDRYIHFNSEKEAKEFFNKMVEYQKTFPKWFTPKQVD